MVSYCNLIFTTNIVNIDSMLYSRKYIPEMTYAAGISL